jgi:hypothetical protein
MLKIYPKIKVALCISGQMRNYEDCYDRLYKYIIKPFEPDIFIHTWSNRGCSPVVTVRTEERFNYKEKTWKKYNNQKINKEEIKKFYKAKKVVVEDFLEEYKEKIENIKIPKWILKHYNNRTAGKVNDGKIWPNCHIHSYLPMFYKIMKANDIKKEQEKINGFKYDLVIRFRSDLLVNRIPTTCLNNLNTLWCNINTGSPFVPSTKKPQVSDRFALSNSENMDVYCSVFKYLNDYWEDKQDKNPSFESWEFPVGDRLLWLHLKNLKKDYQSFSPLAEIFRPDF